MGPPGQNMRHLLKQLVSDEQTWTRCHVLYTLVCSVATSITHIPAQISGVQCSNCPRCSQSSANP